MSLPGTSVQTSAQPTHISWSESSKEVVAPPKILHFRQPEPILQLEIMIHTLSEELKLVIEARDEAYTALKSAPEEELASHQERLDDLKKKGILIEHNRWLLGAELEVYRCALIETGGLPDAVDKKKIIQRQLVLLDEEEERLDDECRIVVTEYMKILDRRDVLDGDEKDPYGKINIRSIKGLYSHIITREIEHKMSAFRVFKELIEQWRADVALLPRLEEAFEEESLAYREAMRMSRSGAAVVGWHFEQEDRALGRLEKGAQRLKNHKAKIEADRRTITKAGVDLYPAGNYKDLGKNFCNAERFIFNSMKLFKGLSMADLEEMKREAKKLTALADQHQECLTKALNHHFTDGPPCETDRVNGIKYTHDQAFVAFVTIPAQRNLLQERRGKLEEELTMLRDQELYLHRSRLLPSGDKEWQSVMLVAADD